MSMRAATSSIKKYISGILRVVESEEGVRWAWLFVKNQVSRQDGKEWNVCCQMGKSGMHVEVLT